MKHGPLQNQLTQTFSALADPTRRAVLARLVNGQVTVGELARGSGISGPSFSRHLKVLEKAGLIERERDAQWRRCRIRPGALRTAFDWLRHYEQIWDEQLEKLSVYVEEINSTAKARSSRVTRRKSSRR